MQALIAWPVPSPACRLLATLLWTLKATTSPQSGGPRPTPHRRGPGCGPAGHPIAGQRGHGHGLSDPPVRPAVTTLSTPVMATGAPPDLALLGGHRSGPDSRASTSTAACP